VARGERRGVAREPRGPAVRDRRQPLVERDARCLDQIGQRACEVAVAAVTEAVAGHLDRRAEAILVEQPGELAALVLVEHGLGDREAPVVELAFQVVPVECCDSSGAHARMDARASGDVRPACSTRESSRVPSSPDVSLQERAGR
jgi:hypothetical protein